MKSMFITEEVSSSNFIVFFIYFCINSYIQTDEQNMFVTDPTGCCIKALQALYLHSLTGESVERCCMSSCLLFAS